MECYLGAGLILTRDGNEYIGSERHFFGFKFIGDDKQINLQSEEVRSYKWVSFKDIDKYLLFKNELEDTKKKISEIFVV